MADLAAVTRIDITATDSTGAAVGSAMAGLNKIGDAARSVQSAFVSLAAAFGVGLSVAGFAILSKDIVLAAESLNNLSKVTGSSVEDLSRLSNAAKVSGVDFDTFRTMLSRMASNMDTLSSTSTKAQKALEFLGVSARDPAQALQETAIALDKYADGAGKAALARDLFGRGGPEMVAALHAMATASNDLITTTTADAEAAAKLAEQVRLLGIHMTTFKDAILRDAVPALTSWINGVTMARAAGAGWLTALDVGTTFADRIGPRLQDAEKELAKLNAELEKDKGYFGNWSSAIVEDIDKVQQRITILRQMKAAQDIATLNLPPGGDPALDARPSVPIPKPEVIDKAKLALDAFTKSLVDEYAKLTLTSEAYKKWQADLLGAQGRLDAVIDRNAALAQAAKDLSKDVNDQGAAWGAVDAAMKKINDTQAATEDSLVSQNAALTLQLATMGMTDVEAQIYATNQRLMAAAAAGNTYQVVLLTNQLQILGQKATKGDILQFGVDAAAAAKQAAEEFKRAADSIDRDLANTFDKAIFDKGKTAFEDLANFARDLFKKLVLQPLLQPVANSLTSIIGGSFVGASGGGGIDGLLTSLLFGGPAGGGGYGMNDRGTGTSGFSGAGGISGLLGAIPGVSAVLPFLPYVGLALAAASALGLFTKTPSQVSGQFGVSAGTGGFEDNAFTKSAFGNLGFVDANTQQFSGQAAQVFNQIVSGALDAFSSRMSGDQQQKLADILQKTTFTTLEGTFTTEDFLQKYGGAVLQQVVTAAFSVLDPALASVIEGFTGTADQVSAMTNSLLAFEDVSKNLPSVIKTELVGAFDGTQGTADKIVAFATAYSSLVDVMNADPLGDALKAVAIGADQSYLSLGTMAQGLKDLGKVYTGTIAQSQALQAATLAYYNALESELATIEQMKTSIAQSGTDIKRSLTLQTLTPTGQYSYYQSEAATAEQQLKTASTPADVQRLHDLVIADLQAAFGLLTPEQQTAMLGQFTSGVDKIDQEATSRLTVLEGVIQKNATDTLSQIRDIFNGVAGKMSGAADTQQSAANTQLIAARTPRKIIITDSNGNEVGTYAGP